MNKIEYKMIDTNVYWSKDGKKWLVKEFCKSKKEAETLLAELLKQNG